MENNLRVIIWGREVGRLTWDIRRNRSVFEYNPKFLKSEFDIGTDAVEPMLYIWESKNQLYSC